MSSGKCAFLTQCLEFIPENNLAKTRELLVKAIHYHQNNKEDIDKFLLRIDELMKIPEESTKEIAHSRQKLANDIKRILAEPLKKERQPHFGMRMIPRIISQIKKKNRCRFNQKTEEQIN